MPRDRAQAIEFRDPSWYAADIGDLLEQHNVARCLHDMPGSATTPRPLGPFAYVRFHGATAKYRGGYSPQRLTAWADRLTRWAAEGVPSYVYFNNDIGGHAVQDAARLRELVARRAG